MRPDKLQELLDKFSRGVCTPQEEKFLTDWYNNIGSQKQSVLPEVERSHIEQHLWSSIHPEILKGKKKASWPVWMRAAMITIPLLALAILYFNREPVSSPAQTMQHERLTQDLTIDHDTRFRNHTNTAEEITLTDGSVVVLQPGSEMVVRKDFGNTLREVELRGEGFFTVKRNSDKPFLVYANEVVTRVLGTSFNIRAYEDDEKVTVAVKTGKVSVYAGTNKNMKAANHSAKNGELILTPNQQMIYDRSRKLVLKQLVENPQIILPDSDLFKMQFDNAEVTEIFKILETNYGVDIRYDEEILSDCRLTTSMSDEGLYERIQVICKAIGASYSLGDDAAITIHSAGCE